MALPFYSNVDIDLNELKNLVIDKLATDPAVANSAAGQIYYNTTDNQLKWFNGTEWQVVGTGSGVGGAEIIIGTDGTATSWSGTTVEETLTPGKQILFYIPTTIDTSTSAVQRQGGIMLGLTNTPKTGSPTTFVCGIYSKLFSGGAAISEFAKGLFRAGTFLHLVYKSSEWLVVNDTNLNVQSKDESVRNVITLTYSQYTTLQDNNQLQENTLYNIIDDDNTDNTSIRILGIANMPTQIVTWEFGDTKPTSEQLTQYMTAYVSSFNRYVDNGILLKALVIDNGTKVNYYYVVNYTVDGTNSSFDFDCLSDYSKSFYIYYNGTNYLWNTETTSACLVGSTLVNTNKGLKFIQDIKVGDKVLSYNFENQQEEYKEVTNIDNHIVGVIYRIVLDDDIIQCTYDEPFYMDTKNTVLGQFISKRDKLFTTSDTEQQVVNVTIKRNTPHTVFDLTVADNGNYFITKNKILVASEQFLKNTIKKED